MRILLVGSGGREHALAQALAASPTCRRTALRSRQPGHRPHRTCHDVAVDDLGGLVALAHQLEADLFVIGPEVPLVAGLGDALRRAGLPVVRPASGAALRRGLEGVHQEGDASRPACRPRATGRFPDVDAGGRPRRARRALRRQDRRARRRQGRRRRRDRDERAAASRAMLVGGAFGDAGPTVVIEERLGGDEVSLLALCDGRRRVRSRAAQDYKRVGDGDTRPEHRRHGRVLARAVVRRGGRRRRRARHRARAAAGRARAAGHAVRGRASTPG